ncbi:MAG: ATP-binding cassette domain-containing protein [Eubacteriaceae bacterium]|nr:ATP-binding cassette domain-containing protein [Eubacteriaceae bacterium]
MARILEIKNLKISFRTNNGTVKAVRDVDMTLDKGETLAIVGESGSGKSVTARAIMGILANNAIVESGEIFYDGKDLLKISEEEFHKIRGGKIAMIFQDPLSSLNPIMKVGQQMTEAMILNGKANQKEAQKEFAQKTRQLTEAIGSASSVNGDPKQSKEAAEKDMEKLRKFASLSNKMESEYNTALDYINSSVSDITDITLDMVTKDKKVIGRSVEALVPKLGKVFNTFLVDENNSGLKELAGKIRAEGKAYAASGKGETLRELLGEARDILTSSVKEDKVDFFSLGYFLTYGSEKDSFDYKSCPIPELNAKTVKCAQEDFLNGFIDKVASGLKYSYEDSLAKKQEALKLLTEAEETLKDDSIPAAKTKELGKTLSKAVERSIDRLEISKDSTAYTFAGAYSQEEALYDKAKSLENRNPRLLSRENRMFRENMDIPRYLENIRRVVSSMKNDYAQLLDKAAGGEEPDFKAKAGEMVDYLKEINSRMVYTVSPDMARDRAISLMDEVGIDEPRVRYNQYPFQLSGGMRQRIVIAIALSANPDILICDEPTTALDVTIQAQILELIKGLKKKRQLSVIFITHDLGVVANMADTIAVMYAGRIVEYGTTDDIFFTPAHPYTWALLSSMPDLQTKEKLEAIPGAPPNMITPPKGDAFAARNKYALKIDFEEAPPMFDISDTHKAATWLLAPGAPKVEMPKIISDRIERMKKAEESGNAGK